MDSDYISLKWSSVKKISQVTLVLLSFFSFLFETPSSVQLWNESPSTLANFLPRTSWLLLPRRHPALSVTATMSACYKLGYHLKDSRNQKSEILAEPSFLNRGATSYSSFFFAKVQVITKDDWDRWWVAEGSTFVWVRNVNLKPDPTTVQHRNCKMSWFVDERNPMIGKWNQGACQFWGSRESVKVSGLKINVQHISLNGKTTKTNKQTKNHILCSTLWSS